jgi:hypothetical protein
MQKIQKLEVNTAASALLKLTDEELSCNALANGYNGRRRENKRC